MQSQPHNLEPGVKTFTLSSSECQKPPPPSATTMTPAAAATLSPPPSTFLMGDYIGMESCVDLIRTNDDDDDDDDDQEKLCDRRWEMNHQKNINNNKNKNMKNKKKEFPPPLPLHMPWVLKRYYTNDGRLIIREEKIKHHEYFKAHRSNGRLTLYLIPLDDDDDDDDDDVVLSPPVDGHIDHVKKPKGDICVDDEDTKVMWDNGDDPLINGPVKKAKGDEDVKGDDVKEPKGKDDEVILLMEEDHESTIKLCSSMADKALTMENGINGGAAAAAAGKCFEYKSSMFGMPLLPPIRTVHT